MDRYELYLDEIVEIKGFVIRFAGQFVRRNNLPESLEEAAAEGIYYMIEALNRHDNKGYSRTNLKKFMKARAFGSIRDLGRREGRRTKYFISRGTDFDNLNSECLNPEEILISREDSDEKERKHRLLCDEIEKLPNELKHIVKLVYFEGLNQRQVSRIYGYDDSQISKRLVKARRILKTRLEKVIMYN